MALRSYALLVFLFLGCEPVLSPQTLRLVQLPADVTTGPALVAVQTQEGRIFVGPNSGGLLRLGSDGGVWEALAGPAMQRFVPDFKEGLALGLSGGLFRASGDAFVDFEPAVPELGHEAFSNVGWAGLLGRDQAGAFWAAASPSFGSLDGRVFVAHLDPAEPTTWTYDELLLKSPRQALPASKPALTSDARLFFRPAASGLWELDLVNHDLVERVPCEHELFRPSHPDYTQCQEDTLVFAGRAGVLFLLNPNHELWRLAPNATEPTLAVKGTLPKLEVMTEGGFNRYSPGGPQTYVDPLGRVWLTFRWGENVSTDTSYLYVVDPSRGDEWVFLSNTLPRNVTPFGVGTAPLLSSTSLDTGLLLFRVAQ